MTSQHHFAETSPILSRTPLLSSTLTEKPDFTRTEVIGLGVVTRAAHAAHLSPNPGLLPAADPSGPSLSPIFSAGQNQFDDSAKKVTPRKPKKRLEEAFSGQTATPPQSVSKTGRKLAPKAAATKMMQGATHGAPFGTSQPPTQHPNLMAFAPDSAEFFGFPMSGPATAPINNKSFWDVDSSMGGMDLGFPGADADMFSATHKMTSSFDWGRDNQMFQETLNMPVNSQIHQQASKTQRQLAPKVSMHNPQAQPPYDINSLISDDPFSMANPGGAMDPGLLFTQQIPTSGPMGFIDHAGSSSRPTTSHLIREPYQHQLRESRRDQEELLRVRKTRENSGGYRSDRRGSSPVKGLHRSSSAGRGRISSHG